jgi:hypothetical protein
MDNSSKIIFSQPSKSFVWKPTNRLRWYTMEVLHDIWKTELQQLWVSDIGEEEWRDIPKE